MIRALVIIWIVMVETMQAATINCTNCEYWTVTGAIGQATSGDIVAITNLTGSPVSCEWSNTLNVTKAITLQGAGRALTTIKDGVNSGRFMDWSLVNGMASRVTAIKFEKGENNTGNTLNRTRVSGLNTDSRTIRIDNCWFETNTGPHFQFFSCLGVIDHNVIRFNFPAGVGHVQGNSWNGTQDVDNFGDGAWAAGDQLGTDQFLFFEDNNVTNVYAASHLTMIDSLSGGRYVWRYSNVRRGSCETHGAEAARSRSGRAFEVYTNVFDGDDGGQLVTYMRGGTGVIFNNRISGYSTASLPLLHERSTDHLFSPIWGSSGRNVWDQNHPGNPQETGTASSAGTLTVTDSTKSWTNNFWAGFTIRRTSGKSVTSIARTGTVCTVTSTAHGFTNNAKVSIWGANEYAYNGFFTITTNTDLGISKFTFDFGTAFTPDQPATGTILCAAGYNYAEIDSNTGTQLTFHDSIYGAEYRLSFTAGDTFEINKVTQGVDQPGLGGPGVDLAGVLTPSLSGSGWTNQPISAWYEWGNTNLSGVADVDFSISRGGGGTYAVIVSGTHYNNNLVKPGYAPYVYPHPLVSGISPFGPSRTFGTLPQSGRGVFR